MGIWAEGSSCRRGSSQPLIALRQQEGAHKQLHTHERSVIKKAPTNDPRSQQERLTPHVLRVHMVPEDGPSPNVPCSAKGSWRGVGESALTGMYHDWDQK